MDQLTANPLFTGGIGIILLTGAAQLARKSLVSISTHIRNHMLVTLEIPSTDKSYDWVLHWMSQHHRTTTSFQPTPRQLSVETKYTRHSSGSSTTSFSLLPGTGQHIINFHGTFLRVRRERDAKRIDLQRGTPWELLTITTLSPFRGAFQALLSESHALAGKLEEGKTIIYTSWSTEWKPFGRPRRKRPLSSVVLAPGVKGLVVNDLHNFLSSSDWYHDRGIPYRRGYLLHGPPGTGKSSLVQALAAEIGYAICVLNLSERGLTDDRLCHLLANMPERSLALLEDVDAAFSRRTQTDEEGYRGANVTFSGLLNALDGVASSEERVIIMTTNHVERLDAALVRPGRVDVRVEIGYATPEVVAEMGERFYGADPTLEGAFVKRLAELGAFGGDGWGVSAAGLQGLFVFFKGRPEKAVEGVQSLVPEEFRRSG
jgi:chaperone BCS1